MKVGFFHDSMIVRDDGRYYSRTLNSEIWKRYLSVFEELVVSTRVTDLDHQEMGIAEFKNVHFLPIQSYKSPRDLIFNLRTVIKEVRSALLQVDCAVIRLPSIIGWIAASLSRSTGTPVLFEVVGCPWDAYRFHSKFGKLLAPIGYIATRKALKNAKFSIYVTQSFLQRRYPSKGKKVGISNVNVEPDKKILEARLARLKAQTLGNSLSDVSQEPVVLGSIGRIDLRYKGHMTGILAVKNLVDQGWNLRYEIVGPGDPVTLQSQIIELGMQEHILLKGPYTSQQINNWLDNIDLYIQPSLTEGLPRSVVEAMSHALPVLLTSVGGHSELVKEAYLFEAGNESELSTRIEQLLNDDWPTVALRNFQVSQKYARDELQARRRSFLLEFRTAIENHS